MSEPIGERLRAAAAALTQERIALRELAALHGGAVDGTLLVLLAALCVTPVPGIGTLAGLALGMLGVAAWRECRLGALPPRVAAFEISGSNARRLLGGLARVYGFAQRFARPGEAFNVNRAMAALLATMAGLIVLPIPLGNLMPAASVAALGLAVVFHDRRLAALALALGALALAFAGAVGALAAYGGWCAVVPTCSLI